MTVATHLVLRLADDRVLAPGVAERRRLARACLQVGSRHGLLAFRAADTHLHVLSTCDRPEAGRFARALEASLSWALDPGISFAPARIVPVEGQFHLHNALLYVLRQAERHGVASDPLHDASSLPDLLGLRPPPAWLLSHVRERLPRLRRADLLPLLGVEPGEGLRPDDLPDAAAGALLLPDLAGNTPASVLGRAAVVRLARPRLAAPAIADLLGCDARTIRRLGGRAVPPPLVEATRAQATLRAGIAASPLSVA